MSQRFVKDSVIAEYLYASYTEAQSAAAIDLGTHGHFLGRVIVGTLGTTTVITLSDGNPAAGGKHISTITPTGPGSLEFGIVCDGGLWVTVAGTGMDVMIAYIPEMV